MISEKQQMRRTHKCESNKAPLRGGLTSSSEEVPVMGLERRGQPGTGKEHQQQWRNAQEQTKPYNIAKGEILMAWNKVKAKGGKGGVDGESISSFASKLKPNLYKIWNRMSSGSYHPQAVLRVEIPKGDAKTRPLGIPTIQDRVAQEVVRMRLEPVVERFFHQDSYGFRPKRSAQHAVKTCRERCWKYDWVLDVDIQKFFDTISHELMMKAVKHHCKEAWIVLYIERWLKAEVQYGDGTKEPSDKGTPQGGVISPLLANLYLHYAFDSWMERTYPAVKFERYADDIVIHCNSQEQTQELQEALRSRLKECSLELHPEKTKIVYCKDGGRKGMYPTKRFTFLGYNFQARRAQNSKTQETFTRFLPAVSNEAKKKFRTHLKKIRLFKATNLSIREIAKELNPIVRGWYGYFSHFYKSALHRINDWLDCAIVRWLRNKYRLTWRSAQELLTRLVKQTPKMFVHWHFRIPGRAV
jgi:group II intron reverse transcriptase/maturase